MRGKLIRIFISIVFLLAMGNSFAQNFNPIFDRYGIDDGLSNETITQVYQDQKGFMWFCTFGGLIKFDGYEFTTYSHIPRDSTSIANDQTWDIVELEDYTFLVATRNGVSRFDPAQEKFVLITPETPQGKKPFTNDTWSMEKLSPDSILFGSNGALWLYTVRENKVENFLPSVTDLRPKNIRIADDGRIWLSTYTTGIFIVDPVTRKYKNFPHDPNDKTSIATGSAMCSFEDSRGNVWVGSEAGLDLFDEKTGTFKHFIYDANNPKGPAKGAVNSIIEDVQGRLWISFQYGLGYYNYGTKKFTILTEDDTNQRSIPGNEVWHMFNDNKGTLWFGLFNSGIAKLDHSKTSFHSYKFEKEKGKGLGAKNVLALDEDAQGRIWLGVDHAGVNVLDRETQRFYYYTHNPSDPNSLQSDAILSIEIDNEGQVWAGAWAGAANRITPQTGKVTRINTSTKPLFINDYHVWSILALNDDEIWIGTHNGGLNRLNLKTNDVKIDQPNDDPHGLSYHWIWDICKDSIGNIWLATANGINKYRPKTDDFEHYLSEDSLKSDVYDVYPGSNGILWAGTNGNGLFSIDTKTGNIKHYTEKDGLPSKLIMSVVEDKKGNLWLGTYGEGLCWFSPEKGLLKKFEADDGVQGRTFSIGASMMLSTGEIAIAGTEGLNIFDPDDISLNTFVPPIVFTDFQIFNKPVPIGKKGSPLKQHISETDTIVLRYEQSVFSISFSALDYTVPEKNKYAYMLDGFEKNWNYVNNKRNITYTNLSPGDYTLLVKASNSDGIWNKEIKKLLIVVTPPWWMTWWFRISVAVIIITSLISYYVYRMGLMKRQNAELERLVNIRTADLNQANTDLQEKQNEILQQNEEITTINQSLDFKNKDLENKNQEIIAINEDLQAKNTYIEKQNELINSSIRYGKTIQTALLPFKRRLDNAFESFILYRPKDVVSGDFYWYTKEKPETPDEVRFLAVADCTGHGVPGAFMSMIGMSQLSEIVRVKGILNPGEILEEMNLGIRKALKQEQTENNDGMDMCLCRIKKEATQVRVAFAGAKRELLVYHAQSKELERIKGSVKKIGGKYKITTKRQFEDHELTLLPNDIIYLTTDGYVDQNNIDRKRFGTAALLKLIENIAELPMDEQAKVLSEKLDTFQGAAPQRDDITIIGLRMRL